MAQTKKQEPVTKTKPYNQIPSFVCIFSQKRRPTANDSGGALSLSFKKNLPQTHSKLWATNPLLNAKKEHHYRIPNHSAHS
jgi:hypothetical protein